MLNQICGQNNLIVGYGVIKKLWVSLAYFGPSDATKMSEFIISFQVPKIISLPNLIFKIFFQGALRVVKIWLKHIHFTFKTWPWSMCKQSISKRGKNGDIFWMFKILVWVLLLAFFTGLWFVKLDINKFFSH